MTFGKALEIVKDGGLVAREGWNGEDMFIFQRPSDNLTVGFIKDTVKSLPDSFKQRLEDAGLSNNYGIDFTSYLCLCHPAKKMVVNGWLASQTDMLSEDWYELT